VAAARDAGIPFIGAYVVARTGVPEEKQAAIAVEFVRERAAFLLAEPERGFAGSSGRSTWKHWDYDKVDAAVGGAARRGAGARHRPSSG